VDERGAEVRVDPDIRPGVHDLRQDLVADPAVEGLGLGVVRPGDELEQTGA